jgi:hypothetical protein
MIIMNCVLVGSFAPSRDMQHVLITYRLLLVSFGVALS